MFFSLSVYTYIAHNNPPRFNPPTLSSSLQLQYLHPPTDFVYRYTHSQRAQSYPSIVLRRVADILPRLPNAFALPALNDMQPIHPVCHHESNSFVSYNKLFNQQSYTFEPLFTDRWILENIGTAPQTHTVELENSSIKKG